jgi:hypothetical protein
MQVHVLPGEVRVEIWDDETLAKSIPCRVADEPALLVVER